MKEQWIIVPKWDRFQHYKDRNPRWIKLYTELVNNPDWDDLTCHQRGVLTTVWVEYALSKGRLSTDIASRRTKGGLKQGTLKALVDAGFIELSASKPLALCYQNAIPEKEKDKETPLPPYRETPKPKFVSANGDNGVVRTCPECGITIKPPTTLADHLWQTHELEHVA